jgi:hypothetical protein
VARRRYGKPSPAISGAGQAAQPRDPTGDESLSQELQPRQEYGKSEPASQPQPTSEPAQPVTGLRDQLADQRRYAEYHALQQYIASNFPGALPHEAQWLMMNPHHLQNPMLVHHAAKIALDRGIPRHDPQFLHFVGQLLDQHHAAMMQPPAPPMPPPMPPSMPMPAHMHVDVEQSDHGTEPGEEHMAAHSVSAPVSRGSETYSADYEPGDASRVTLSKAEREHAEAAGVSVEEYGRQKLKMLKMKKAKVIRDE